MIVDKFRNTSDSPVSPAERCFGIAPADGTELPYVTKAIYVGSAGDVTLVPARGAAPVTFRNLSSGSILDVRARTIEATGTTASDLVGLA